MAPLGQHLAPPVALGAEPGRARAWVVAAHGRDQDPAYLVEHLVGPVGRDDVRWLLPAADAGSWYPMRFHDPQAELAPWREASLDAFERAVEEALAAGATLDRLLVAGFSQGACLMAELLARRPRAYAGAALLTGCLMGPEEDVTAAAPGSLRGLPVHLSGARTDAWIPPERVARTAEALQGAGARVELAPRDDPDHRIAPADVAATRALLDAAAA